mmetsp:Transcript_9476/g.20642  ORF Transcript_9476/g.20642 Transcript_9476/m.20642 type:complete len:110 (-) Transcript_9476:557-886(-)
MVLHSRAPQPDSQPSAEKDLVKHLAAGRVEQPTLPVEEQLLPPDNSYSRFYADRDEGGGQLDGEEVSAEAREAMERSQGFGTSSSPSLSGGSDRSGAFFSSSQLCSSRT